MGMTNLWGELGGALTLLFIIGVIACFTVGCDCNNKKAKQGDTRVVKEKVPVCEEATADARSKFVLQCVKKGTPLENIGKSKESIKCKSYAEEVYCPLIETEVTQVYYNKKWINLDERPDYVDKEWMGP